MKPFKYGLFVGRFQHFHKGHEEIVSIAKTLCDDLLILISDANEKNTVINPFDIDIREELIKKIYGNNVIINRINKYNSEEDELDFRDYVIGNAKEVLGQIPDFIIYGSDVTLNPWFDTRGIKEMLEIIVPRSRLEVSATDIRKFLINGDKQSWEKYTNISIHEYYNVLRDKLMKVVNK